MTTILMTFLRINCPNFTGLVSHHRTKFQIGMAATLPATPLLVPRAHNLLLMTSSWSWWTGRSWGWTEEGKRWRAEGGQEKAIPASTARRVRAAGEMQRQGYKWSQHEERADEESWERSQAIARWRPAAGGAKKQEMEEQRQLAENDSSICNNKMRNITII